MKELHDYSLTLHIYACVFGKFPTEELACDMNVLAGLRPKRASRPSSFSYCQTQAFTAPTNSQMDYY